MRKLSRDKQLIQKVFVLLLLAGPIIGLACAKISGNNKALGDPRIHGPVLTEGWYQQDKNRLDKQLEDYLVIAQKYFDVHTDPATIRALIAPHASYAFVGLCAATAYQALLQKDVHKPHYKSQKNGIIKRVIVLAPSHYASFKNIALPNFTLYQTVLGDLPVDQEAIAQLGKKTSLFKINPEAYRQEHALEMQLPFLQKTVANFKLVPLIIGTLTTNDLPEIVSGLKEIIDDTTLLVLSSDFVHYGRNFDYTPFHDHILDRIRLIDSRVVQALASLSPKLFDEAIQQTRATVCGREPLRIFLALVEAGTYQGLESRLTCYYTSPQIEKARTKNGEEINAQKLLDDVPDTNATHSVSYVGMVFTTQKNKSLPLIDRWTGYEKKVLLRLARQSIAQQFMPPTQKKDATLMAPIASAGLIAPAGAFVTLTTKQGDLRGCIGRIVTNDPLFVTVRNMAKAAAFEDSRFSPLSAKELENIVIDISLLEPPVKIASWKDIIIGKRGVILTKGPASAIFLPQFAPEQKWDIATTLEHLSLKAGLASDAWKEGCTFEVFEGCEIKEVL
jgi:hypothetical protein